MQAFSNYSRLIILFSLLFICMHAERATADSLWNTRLETEQQDNAPSQRFQLELTLGTGLSYNSQAILSGLYPVDPLYRSYLDTLDLHFSDNLFSLGFLATVNFTRQLGLYFNLPYAVVQIQDDTGIDATLFEDDDIQSGAGDLTTGLYYRLLTGTPSRPEITLGYEQNDDKSEYTSIGNGLEDTLYYLRLRQIFGSNYFVSAYFQNQQSDDVGAITPGDVDTTGLGLGWQSGGNSISFSLIHIDAGRTLQNNLTVIEPNDSLAISISAVNDKGTNITLTVSNIDDGLDIEKNTVGIQFSRPILDF